MKWMVQFQENKRPSGFVILSAAFVILSAAFVILSGAKDLCPARDPSLRSELAQDAKRRDDNPELASFDSQNVFFEMYCPSWARKSGGLPSRRLEPLRFWPILSIQRNNDHGK